MLDGSYHHIKREISYVVGDNNKSNMISVNKYIYMYMNMERERDLL